MYHDLIFLQIYKGNFTENNIFRKNGKNWDPYIKQKQINKKKTLHNLHSIKKTPENHISVCKAKKHQILEENTVITLRQERTHKQKM